MTLVHPPIEAAQEVVLRLRHAHIACALGGSGLLGALGLEPRVRDWDLTTDANAQSVAPLLSGLHYERIEPNGIYATEAMFRIQTHGASVDLMCRFAVHNPAGTCTFPTVVDGAWQSLPLGAPVVWAAAYALIDRPEKAERLWAHLAANHGSPTAVAAMLGQPLPPEFASRLRTLSTAL